MDLTIIFKEILSLSLMGSVVAILIIVTKAIFRYKINATWHYYIWFLLLLRLIMPFSFETSVSIFNLIPDPSEEKNFVVQQTVVQEVEVILSVPTQEDDGSIETYVDAEIQPEPKDVPTETSTVEGKHNYELISYTNFSIVWILGVTAFLFYIFTVNYVFLHRVNKSSKCKDAEVINILNECKSQLKVDIDLPVYLDIHLNSPSICGLIRPKLLMPPNLINQLTKNELKHIFLHEVSHLKRKDIIVSWLLLIVQSLHWFNPIVWYSFRKMREDCEVACDSYVLSQLKLEEHKEYGETIINLLKTISKSKWKLGVAGIASNQSSLKRRIKMIALFRGHSRKWAVVAAITIITIGVVGYSKGLEETKVGLKQNPKNEDVKGSTLSDNTLLQSDVIEVNFDDIKFPSNPPRLSRETTQGMKEQIKATYKSENEFNNAQGITGSMHDLIDSLVASGRIEALKDRNSSKWDEMNIEELITNQRVASSVFFRITSDITLRKDYINFRDAYDYGLRNRDWKALVLAHRIIHDLHVFGFSPYDEITESKFEYWGAANTLAPNNFYSKTVSVIGILKNQGKTKAVEYIKNTYPDMEYEIYRVASGPEKSIVVTVNSIKDSRKVQFSVKINADSITDNYAERLVAEEMKAKVLPIASQITDARRKEVIPEVKFEIIDLTIDGIQQHRLLLAWGERSEISEETFIRKALALRDKLQQEGLDIDSYEFYLNYPNFKLVLENDYLDLSVNEVLKGGLIKRQMAYHESNYPLVEHFIEID